MCALACAHCYDIAHHAMHTRTHALARPEFTRKDTGIRDSLATTTTIPPTLGLHSQLLMFCGMRIPIQMLALVCARECVCACVCECVYACAYY